MNMFKKNGGFTLVELIVVIAILAILAGVAVPAYSGYIEKAKDAAVITELDAIATAAQAANATAGAISTIELTGGNQIKVTAATGSKIAEKYAADFDMFYGTSTTTVAGGGADITLTLEKTIDVTGTSYKNGATWHATDPDTTGPKTVGWNAN